MKFKIKPPKPIKDKFQWNPWFAWRPVIVEEDGVKFRVWLELIERKINKDYFAIGYREFSVYRLPPKPTLGMLLGIQPTETDEQEN